ncbi:MULTISPECIES: hypothetical protein [Snodgrassella]|uniref:hypothetical protein n=1 Tax=Snodgrassella TaxID=1193515 RepID=UPI000996DF0A|nr:MULTISPECIES: hypothetical protein [Snodgrassella]MBI0165774.1 hypothetical protein [Snodgrassella sp. M0351]OOX78657.1 hypothetical protein BGH94_07335 [Snodgrassella alvi]ORF00517.1 hypothetical protein BGH95_08595 [Snodgrassella alvi]
MLLVKNKLQAIENIEKFQSELNKKNKKNKLVATLGQFSKWFAFKSESGQWIFGPSKFIGYQGISLEEYEKKDEYQLDGRKTDDILKQWKSTPTKEELEELTDNINSFLDIYGKHLKKNAAIYLLNKSQQEELEQSKAFITILKTWDKRIQKKVIQDIQTYSDHYLK